MATTVGQYQVSTITDPADSSAMVASTMRSVSSSLRTGINSHDNESGLHLQSSVAGSRPAAGTAGRKWLDTDTLLVKYDNGSSWVDLAYLKSSGGTVTGAVTISAGGIDVTGGITGELATAAQTNVTSLGTLTALTCSGTITTDGLAFSGATPKILSGATSFNIKNNADSTTLFSYTEGSKVLGIGSGASGHQTIITGHTALYLSTSGACDIQVGASMDTTDTAGFLRLNGIMAGAPVGAASNGAICIDSSNSRLYVRVGGAWKYAALS